MSYEVRYRDEGTDVRRLQEFLVETGAQISPDGLFGPNTRTAILNFQRKLGLEQSGYVDAPTFDALSAKGLVLLGPRTPDSRPGTNWPERPDEPPQPDAELTTRLFGVFEFRHTPTADNPEKIEILHGWEQDNIVAIDIPQLNKCLFAAGRHYAVNEVGKIRCHRLAQAAFAELFARWEEAQLMDRILTCAGAFNARLKRGATNPTRSNLSNHSWGTAIDVNAWENPLGHTPVAVGARGALRELVGIANSIGFFWGGHYASRPDGMHFELARI